MKNLILFFILIALAACSSDHKKQKPHGNNSTKAGIDSFNRKKTATDQTPEADDEPEPSFAEVLSDLKASYNKIEKIDKQVIDGKDTMQLHETYYCLHDSSLRVAGKYFWGGDTTKDFIVNTFATKIVVIKNRDTVFNKIIKKSEFNPALWDRLQEYAIIMFPNYEGYNKSTGEFSVWYSLTIPLTDVGAPAGITIDKKGRYKILDENAKSNGFVK